MKDANAVLAVYGPPSPVIHPAWSLWDLIWPWLAFLGIAIAIAVLTLVIEHALQGVREQPDSEQNRAGPT